MNVARPAKCRPEEPGLLVEPERGERAARETLLEQRDRLAPDTTAAFGPVHLEAVELDEVTGWHGHTAVCGPDLAADMQCDPRELGAPLLDHEEPSGLIRLGAVHRPVELGVVIDVVVLVETVDLTQRQHALSLGGGPAGYHPVMEKRYQVFISSTFVDLVDERREVMQALLEMDCLPAGMELFPAGNTDQWTLIKGVIDQSDYYLVILGGRYGSTTEEGISYTEKEYDYALERGIPVMGFVPAEPDAIPNGKTDKNDKAAEKLDAFRTKVQLKMTRDWSNAEDLGSKVTRGLVHLIKNNPRPGWVRGDQAMTPETRTEIAELKARIAQFEKREVENAVTTSAQIDGSFAHGQEEVELSLNHSGYSRDHGNIDEDGALIYSWDEIMEVLGPSMIDEAPEPALRQTFNSHMLNDVKNDLGAWTRITARESVQISDKSWGSIIVQLRALRLIDTGSKKRTVSDKAVYWKLTQAGDDYLVSLRAVPSSAPTAPSS